VSEQDLHTAKAHHTKEVLDVVLPANHEPTKIMEPGEKPFHSPTSTVTARRATALRWSSARSAMWRDHLDAITPDQVLIQTIAVICSVADQSCREDIEEAVPEYAFNELAFVWRSAFDTNGERKTVMIGESHDFRPACRVW
jgi:hypothetical protein